MSIVYGRAVAAGNQGALMLYFLSSSPTEAVASERSSDHGVR